MTIKIRIKEFGRIIMVVLCVGIFVSARGETGDPVRSAWVRCEAPADAAIQESCDVFALLHDKLQPGLRSPDAAKFKDAQLTLAKQLIGKNPIITNAMAEEICRERLPETSADSTDWLKTQVAAITGACEALRFAQKCITEQIKQSPLPAEYYVNRAAERIASTAVKISESAWLRKKKIAHPLEKTRPRE